MPPDPLGWLDDEWQRWVDQGLVREPVTRTSAQRGREIEVAGWRLVNFGSNDYLSLASDPRVLAAAKEAIDRVGFGAGASPLVTGRGALHEELEEALAVFEHAEAALLFPTGFAANAGTIPALVGAGDLIFSDAKNHASIIDGCRLSGAAVHVYRHGDMQQLADLFREHAANKSRKLIATDGLFSMDGDLAPLPEIVALAEKHGAMVLVDEAHATGVFGARGRGACDHFGVAKRVTVRVGTLSKALGSAGGFVVGSRRVVDWLRNRARSYMFSTAMPEALAAAALAALTIIQDRTTPDLGSGLLKSAADLRQELLAAGFQVGSSASQIIPVILGDPARTMAVAGRLREAGFFVPGIRPPSVPPGESLVRISLTTDHAPATLDRLVAALTAANSA